MDTKNCPDCNKSMAMTATRCRCGWKQSDFRQYVECDKCRGTAIMRKYLPTGWANLCEACNLEIHQKRAEAYCAERGLKTVAQMREWLLKNKLMVKRGPMRQPGEDTAEEIGI